MYVCFVHGNRRTGALGGSKQERLKERETSAEGSEGITKKGESLGKVGRKQNIQSICRGIMHTAECIRCATDASGMICGYVALNHGGSVVEP